MTANPHLPPADAVTALTAARWLGNRYPRQEHGIGDAISAVEAGRAASFGAYRLAPAQDAKLTISLGPQAAAFAGEPLVSPQMLNASRHAQAWIDQASARDLVPAAIPAITSALSACRSGTGAPLGHDEAAWLLVILSRSQPRNHAWNQMAPQHAQAHAALWANLTRRAPRGLAADVAALLAFTSLQTGDTATAHAALLRASADNPRHKITRILGAAMQAGLPQTAYRPTPSPRIAPDQMLGRIVSQHRAAGGPELE